MKIEFEKPNMHLVFIPSSEIIATSGDADGSIDEVPWEGKERRSMWDDINE